MKTQRLAYCFALPKENKTIMASKYQLYLPTEQQLLQQITKEGDNE